MAFLWLHAARFRVVALSVGASNKYTLASIGGEDDQRPANADARKALTGLLRRTITDAIKQKVERNWSVPAGVLDAGKLVVALRIQLGPDGSVSRVEIVDADGGRKLPLKFELLDQSGLPIVCRLSARRIPRVRAATYGILSLGTALIMVGLVRAGLIKVVKA